MKIFEIFSSIQSEGSMAGTSATFIRFAGCNLSCVWCDEDALKGDEMSVEEVIGRIKTLPANYVVITGGESLVQYDAVKELTRRLREKGYRVGIETNGTIRCDNIFFDHITVSPKENVLMKCKQHLDKREVIQLQCDDLKIIENGQSIAALNIYAKKFIIRKDKFLQPRSNDPLSIVRCVELVKYNPDWRLSLQFHKWIGIK